MNKYEKLEKIKQLLDQGVLSEQEYASEKAKIMEEEEDPSLKPPPVSSAAALPWGMEVNLYCMLMHLAFLLAQIGWIIALVMWAANKDKHPAINQHGKALLNWMITLFAAIITWMILAAVFFPRPSFSFTPFEMLEAHNRYSWTVMALFLLIIFALIFGIMGAVAAYNGKSYRYPAFPIIK